MNKTIFTRYPDNRIIDFACTYTQDYKIFMSVSLSVLTVVAVIGNTLILASIFRFRQQFKGSYYILLGNLAISDLLFGLVEITIIIELILDDDKNNWALCVVKFIGVPITYAASLLTLLLISIDRFMAVTHPIKHIWRSRKSSHFYGVIIFIWVFCFAFVPLCLNTLNQKALNEVVLCRIAVVLPYETDIAVSSVLIFMIVLNGVLYSIIFYRLNKRPFLSKALAMRTKKRTKLTLIVFAIYSLSWVPFFVCSIVPLVSPDLTQDALCIREYVIVLAYKNSSVNCILYGVMSNKFRTAFRQLFKKGNAPFMSSLIHREGKNNVDVVQCRDVAKTKQIKTVSISNL